MARNDDEAARRRAKRREELGEEAVPETTPAETPNSAPEAESNVDAATDLEREAVEAGGTAVAGGESTNTGGPRIFNFFRASWAELQRVRWPNGAQVAQGTAVTLGFVVIAGAFLGLADVAARQIVNLII